jgi:hypothetical protein
MKSRHVITSLITAVAGFSMAMSFAEEPTANAAKGTAATSEPAPTDRDGKPICGWNLMNDSERGGYKNIMHQTKAIEDRDSIRVDHCAKMKARAKERGVSGE